MVHISQIGYACDLRSDLSTDLRRALGSDLRSDHTCMPGVKLAVDLPGATSCVSSVLLYQPLSLMYAWPSNEASLLLDVYTWMR